MASHWLACPTPCRMDLPSKTHRLRLPLVNQPYRSVVRRMVQRAKWQQWRHCRMHRRWLVPRHCAVSMAKKDWHYLYDSKRWKALRLYQLGREPLCRKCKEVERLSPACIADHVTPHKGDICLFFDADNLQSLCKTCHDVSKQREEHRGYAHGCDASGIPLSRRS
jgi:5-methylcytosine-specific restriction protein A